MNGRLDGDVFHGIIDRNPNLHFSLKKIPNPSYNYDRLLGTYMGYSDSLQGLSELH